jgi:Tfp pilus assembly protein PilV
MKSSSAFVRGVSLIEAVVALAVMATGLLGVVGVQATLRANSDIAKQRAEGVRLAQQKIEAARFFRDVTGPAPAYDGLAPGIEMEILEPVQQADGSFTSNTTFTRTTTVTLMDARAGVPELEAVPRAKSVAVNVSWRDRAGQLQSVTLNAAVSGIAPALAGSLAVPPEGGTPVRQPLGRSAGIPRGAVDLGDGRSGFVPPGLDAASNVVWVFRNTDALISLCVLRVPANGVNTANIDCTGASYARLVAGYIRYSLGAMPDALEPESLRPAALDTIRMTVSQTQPFAQTVQCATNIAITPALYTPYYCAVPIGDPAVNPGWTGSLVAEPGTVFPPDPPPPLQASYRLCRYIVDRQDLDITETSVTVARSFDNIRASLQNRNFLVVQRASTCPSPFPDPYPLPNPVPVPIVVPTPFPLWLVQHQPAP